jgi:hypothetical protein
MKKLLFALPVVLLVAAGCNPPTTQPTTQATPTPQQQVIQNPTATSTPTAVNQQISVPKDWESYSNVDWGFSISYPNKYQLNDNHFEKALPYYKNLVDILSVPNKQSSPFLSINVVNDFGERQPRHITDITDYVQSAHPAYQSDKITPITINGNKGYQIDITNDPGAKPRYIVLQDKDGVIFELFFPADSSELNAVAATFQFTK